MIQATIVFGDNGRDGFVSREEKYLLNDPCVSESLVITILNDSYTYPLIFSN